MGKQSKRKSKGGRRGAGQHHRPTGLADDPAATAGGVTAGGSTTDEASPLANIIKKIRHGDPRVRHAALVGLSSTLYDSNALSNAAKKKRGGAATGATLLAEANNPTLLRALSEKILDVDIPCATTAVGCLSNYVSFYCSGIEAVTEENNNDEVEVASDVMVPILLQRIQTSLGTVHSLGSQIMTAGSAENNNAKDDSSNSKKGKSASTATDKLWPSLKEQWSLLSLTLVTLAGLIENCPLAVRRLGANAFPQLLSVLPLAGDSIQFIPKEGSIPQEKEGEPILDAATNATRALHSLLDDNTLLIASLPLGSMAASTATTTPSVMSAVTQLTHAITNKSFTDMTRLHASGAILSLRKVLVLEKEIAPSNNTTREEEALIVALQSCTNDVIVPMLQTLFDFHNGDSTASAENSSSPKYLLSQMIDLSQKLTTMKQDETMESQIVNEVNARKEPTRDIARRQKKMKEEKKKKEQELKKQQGDNMDTAMGDEDGKGELKEVDISASMVEEEEEDNGENFNSTEENQEAMKQELDDVVQSWKDLVGSHKLALELVANLCSGSGEDEMDGMDNEENDDEHMWDSDDEAKLVAAASTNVGGAETTKCTPCEQATYNSMSFNHLPEQILVFFRKWVEFLPSMDMGDVPPPALVSADVDEILSTCALCLGNVVATSNLPTWSAAPAAATVAMITKKQVANNTVVENGLQMFWWELVSMLNPLASSSNNKSHVTSVMLSLLRSQPESLTLVDSPTLDRLFSLLQHQSENNENANNIALVQMHSHIISMLGVLCSEEQQSQHSAEIDARVCRALLERLRSAMTLANTENVNDNGSVIITHEILNVFMDMYGGDDCHEEVFAREDVLGHFQRCLPGFKRRVKKVAAGASGDFSGEVGVWGETALNASRFIKYKKG